LDGPLISAPVWHVFDSDVFTEVASPGTMMTNAGSLTWAVEFRPREFIVAMKRTHRTVVQGEFGIADPPRKNIVAVPLSG
jgi:hypothetical protein